MPYNWDAFGDSKNPTIALIAPSNGLSGEAGQKVIRDRIEKLVARGFCVKVPRYEDGQIVVQSDVVGRKQSNRLGKTITPAVDAKTGVNQIIDCVRYGWNMMPLMGGDNFEAKIPLIVQYFQEHPDQKRPAVKIFGLSNSTYATILASYGICSFISTPFTSIFSKETLQNQATQLELVMKDKDAEEYPRAILQDTSQKLGQIARTYHYPLNFGNIITEVEKSQKGDESLSLHIKDGQEWSLGFEGFLQRPGNIFPVNYPFFLDQFLQKHQENLPKFIEIGNIATRLDGLNGYAVLEHDSFGQIIVDEGNIEKILPNKSQLKADIVKISQKKTELESKESRTPFEQKTLEILSLIPPEIFTKSQGDQDFDADDIRKILEAQNAAIVMVVDGVKQVVEQYDIPLILNTKNGHCANMSVVNGGLNSVKVVGDEVVMKMENSANKFPLKNPLSTKLNSQKGDDLGL
jgi:hypothetical protein